MRTQYFFFPIVFPSGIKAKKLINIYGRALSSVVLFPLFKTKLVLCAINQISLSPIPFAIQCRSGEAPNGNGWRRKDALWWDLPLCVMWLCLLRGTVLSLLPEVFFHLLFSWHGRLLVRGNQKALLTCPPYFWARGQAGDCTVHVQIWSQAKSVEPEEQRLVLPGHLLLSLDAEHSLIWNQKASPSEPVGGPAPDLQAAFRAFQKQKSLLLAWLPEGLFPDRMACANHIHFFFSMMAQQ